VLLIGGDEPTPLGPYPDAGSLLREGILAACGVREIGIARHPEGNPRVPLAELERAFDEKLAIASAQGLGAYVVTQFSFSPARILEHCTSLARRAPGVPVYVGLAGPTSAGTLLRFAQRCGVSASLRALRDQGMAAVNLVTHTDPGDQLARLRAIACRTRAGHRRRHVFSFGGSPLQPDARSDYEARRALARTIVPLERCRASSPTTAAPGPRRNTRPSVPEHWAAERRRQRKPFRQPPSAIARIIQ
jgi:methylenetetrahydrofolate reductase (NADPH)